MAQGYSCLANSQRACELLYALRAGEKSFDQVRRAVRPRLKVRAMYFSRKWRQTLLVTEDVLSLMEVAMWRAVDSWDPTHPRAKALPEYVDCEMGRAAEVPLKQAAGWPDSRRSKPAQQVDAEEVRGESGPRVTRGGSTRHIAVEPAIYRLAGSQVPRQHDLLEMRECAELVLATMEKGLPRKVVEMVLLEAYTVEGAADKLYSSLWTRRRYGFLNQKHARQMVAMAACRARKTAETIHATSAA